MRKAQRDICPCGSRRERGSESALLERFRSRNRSYRSARFGTTCGQGVGNFEGISMAGVRCYGASMGAAPVELRVGGQTYRVVASAEEAELRRLADMVDARLR